MLEGFCKQAIYTCDNGDMRHVFAKHIFKLFKLVISLIQDVTA